MPPCAHSSATCPVTAVHTRLDLPDGCYAHHAISPPPPRVAQAVLIGWQAHTSEIVTLVYVPTMEGLVSASRDCMVRLWTLSGEQVGSLSKTIAYLLEYS